jgi:simple sugar transport system substrate-binding protein
VKNQSFSAFKITIFIVFVLIMSCNKSPKEETHTQMELLKKYMPAQMADDVVKVAVVSNIGDNADERSFINGCVLEGESLGFIVDVFPTNADPLKCQEVVDRIVKSGYDGLILSHGGPGYTYNFLKKVTDNGIKVVTFNSYPYFVSLGVKRGDILWGVTSTLQQDEELAFLSLQSLIDSFPKEKRPIKVIRAWIGPGILSFEKYQKIYNQFVKEGKIEEVGSISQVAGSNTMFDDAKNALNELLKTLPENSIDAIWASYNELAKGCLKTLDLTRQANIKMSSIGGISDDDIELMRSHPNSWLSTASTNLSLIGAVNMRLLAAKFVGEETPKEFYFRCFLIETFRLNESNMDMSNISLIYPEWTQIKGMYNHYPWMDDIKSTKSQ